MSETTYDDFLEKLVPDDLADDNFQTLFSTSPKAYVTYQKKKKTLRPSQIYLITYSQVDIDNSHSWFVKNSTAKMK